MLAVAAASSAASAQPSPSRDQPEHAPAAPATSAAAAAPQPDAFTPLFNGRDLAGWWGAETENPADYLAASPELLAVKKYASLDNINQHWRVENGELVNDGAGLYLTTDRLFGDFELILEYRTVAGADSGIYLRGYPQVQIWDTTEAGGKWNLGADKGSGGLWNNGAGEPGKDPAAHADRPFGQWNALRIIMIGECVTVELNGHIVVDHARMANYFDRAKPLLARGPIQLQTHGGEIRFRSVAIREIGADEANVLLRRVVCRTGEDPAEHNWRRVFNGMSFVGWNGPVDNYEIDGEALRCRPGTGGTIYTEEQYEDFEARFEFILPPGGNNGLAIRYPGEGDTAYVGMCELQVLDSEHPKYARLDPRQYHGSAYGLAPAHRGYLRPAGQWNFQHVRVVGSTITVELNGTRILDTDLATVTDAMSPIDKFAGRSRTRGHFGFAGHGDPVAFRRIDLRPIEKAGEKVDQPR